MPRNRKKTTPVTLGEALQPTADRLHLVATPDPAAEDLARSTIPLAPAPVGEGSTHAPIPDEALPAFPAPAREPFPRLPEGFEARGTFEAAGVRVNRHRDGSSALQFKDGARMSPDEKLVAQDTGYGYDPARKQWPNPAATWEQKVEDARAISEARLRDRER